MFHIEQKKMMKNIIEIICYLRLCETITPTYHYPNGICHICIDQEDHSTESLAPVPVPVHAPVPQSVPAQIQSSLKSNRRSCFSRKRKASAVNPSPSMPSMPPSVSPSSTGVGNGVGNGVVTDSKGGVGSDVRGGGGVSEKIQIKMKQPPLIVENQRPSPPLPSTSTPMAQLTPLSPLDLWSSIDHRHLMGLWEIGNKFNRYGNGLLNSNRKTLILRRRFYCQVVPGRPKRLLPMQ